MPSSRLWRVLLALLLLAALFCVPSLVLTGSEWLPELTGAVENYVPFWKGLLRFLIFCAWCWVWLWTEGSALQILLALLLQFCGIWCGATSFLRNSDKIYEKKRNASQAPGRRFWPSAAARTRTRSWRPLWTRWWPPGSLIVRSVGWRWTTRPTPCDCYCSKWGGM